MTPFFMKSTGEAVRAFSDLANDRQTMVGQHPADFTLFKIGDFEDRHGRFIPLGANESFGTALEMQTQE